jgi:CDP-diacylglycerol--glycerol-3-phosphate 3-phosphatidyltransferase
MVWGAEAWEVSMANILTIFRLLLVPVFIYVLATSPTGSSLLAAALFALAALTDFLDGQVARRTNTVTEFGRVADPLADRLLVASALIVLLVRHKLPTIGLMTVLFRDALMMAGYYVLARQGIRMSVIWLGKLSSAVLMVALFLIIAGLAWAVWVFWAGVALSVLSGIVYSVRGVAQLRRPRPTTRANAAAADRRQML